ncbi:metallophosphoesterase [Candidatus Woesearchaeota archaeon]|nr:metallophosphoesterase [Candidatus Woesearchaeota archaeon]
MLLLAFTDVHMRKSSLDKIKEKAIKHKPDFLISCGDLSNFGNGLEKAAKFLNDLKIKTLMIPSNHESPEQVKKVCEKYENLIYLHKGMYEHEDFVFFGFGNEGFSYVDEDFEPIAKQFKKDYNKNKILIFITHAPIYNTKLDKLEMGHRGSKSSRKFIEEVQPFITLCGHFHETFGKQDKINQTTIINPGPDGIIIEI